MLLVFFKIRQFNATYMNTADKWVVQTNNTEQSKDITDHTLVNKQTRPSESRRDLVAVTPISERCAQDNLVFVSHHLMRKIYTRLNT